LNPQIYQWKTGPILIEKTKHVRGYTPVVEIKYFTVEMKAIFIILQSLSLCLSNKLVKIYTDNQNVTRICNVGSMNTRQTKFIGGTNQLLSLDQSNANASTPLLPGVQYRELKLSSW
jgi:hypothetical protein